MSVNAPMVVVFAALLVAGAGLIVYARRDAGGESRAAILGSGVAVILAACAGFASMLAVQHLSARAGRHAEIEAVRAEDDAQEAIRALIEQGNRLAGEAAAERDLAPAAAAAALPTDEPASEPETEPAAEPADADH